MVSRVGSPLYFFVLRVATDAAKRMEAIARADAGYTADDHVCINHRVLADADIGPDDCVRADDHAVMQNRARIDHGGGMDICHKCGS